MDKLKKVNITHKNMFTTRQGISKCFNPLVTNGLSQSSKIVKLYSHKKSSIMHWRDKSYVLVAYLRNTSEMI